MNIRIRLISTFILILMISCVSIYGKKKSSEPQLAGTSWNLTNISGEDVTGKGVTLKIRKKELSGKSFINHYFGKYIITEGNISVSHLGMTEMAGEKFLMDLEYKYIGILQNVKKVEVIQDKLFLRTDNGETLEFILSDDNIMY